MSSDSPLARGRALARAIAQSGMDIYEPLDEHPELVYDADEMEAVLREELVGQAFNAPIRTRSKLVKGAVCRALGYPEPPSFKRVKPRFPGQDLDVYAQQSNNVQVWNEEVTPTRRYALLGLDAGQVVSAVRVVEGAQLVAYDKTGTLTSKYQAKRQAGRTGSVLVSESDTAALIRELAPVDKLSRAERKALSPVAPPERGRVLTISALFDNLQGLVGKAFPDPGSERLRGEQLHRLVCEELGLGDYADSGRFPDIVCQALEVKLQTAETIDLGLVNPTGTEFALTLSPRLQHRDARYLVVYGRIASGQVGLTATVMTTGADFFNEFRQFGGLGQNKKLQLRLPADFFC